MLRDRVRPLRRHLLRVALLGLVPLTVFAALALFNAARAQRAELAQSTQDLARAVASAVQAELDSTINALASVGRTQALQGASVRERYEKARSLLELQPSWKAITVADAQGRLLFRTGYPPGTQPPEAIEPETLRQALRTMQPTVGPAVRDREGHVSVPVRYPVVENGTVAAVITAVLTPDRMLAVLKRQRVPQNWVIAILDSDLRIVARSRAQEQFALRSATPALQELVNSGHSEGSGSALNQEGVTVVTGYSRTPEYGWLIAVGAPSPPVGWVYTPTLALYFAGIGGSLAICAVLALRSGRRLAREIAAATEMADGLGQRGREWAMPSRIAELQRLQQALQQAHERLLGADAAQRHALEEARAAGRAKDEFLAVLGHELRNPLAPMVSALYLLDHRCDDRTERERAILRRQLQHMRRLVDDLLDVARITRGAVEIDPAPVDLARIIPEVLEDLRQTGAGAPPIGLSMPARSTVVLGDSARLRQVFTNLLTNAVRYGEGKPIDVRIDCDAHEVRVAVQDHGIGMDERTLARVFEPFYQGQEHGGTGRGSLGLGLAIVRAIVLAHGGRVQASSEGPGRGSRFEVTLPAGGRSGVAHDAAISSPASLA